MHCLHAEEKEVARKMNCPHVEEKEIARKMHCPHADEKEIFSQNALSACGREGNC